ncbi:MAG: DNA mismatch repair protein MutS, partial [Cyanobium sp.]
MSRSSASSRSAGPPLSGRQGQPLPAGQQLSLGACLDPDDATQGSLFPARSGPGCGTGEDAAVSRDEDPGDGLLEAEALEQAARERPRQRQSGPAIRPETADPQSGSPPAAEPDASLAGPAAAGPREEESQRWHHHSLVDPTALTPVLRHYVQLKAAHPERVLLYRLGDFYEFFFEDAILLSRLLELTLTGKEAGKAIGRVPMAGIPFHAAERYCAELVRQGLSVALCDQLETTPAKGALLKRDITRVLTPGTVLEEGMLAARRNNWLCAVVFSGPQGSGPRRWGLAVADISTGEFRVSEREGEQSLHQELLRLEAAEVIWPEPHASSGGEPGDGAATPAWCPDGRRLSRLPLTPFEAPEARARLLSHFRLASLDGLGLGEVPLALRAAGGLLAYLEGTQPAPLDPPTVWHAGDQLVLDAQTRRNLELCRTQMNGALQGSLLWALDRTATAMGGRCLRRWIEAPLVDRGAILQRQDAVSELVEHRPLRQALRRLLRPMGDLERLAGRCGAGTASARDLVALADGLERLPRLAALLAGTASGPLSVLSRPWPELAEIAADIRHHLVEAPPMTLGEGGLIHDGVDPRLDGLRNLLDDQEAWLTHQERLERQASANPNVRLQYHRTFGYFLAVSRARASTVPDHWIRRQTLANEERFVTPAPKQREGRILQLRARSVQRELDLLTELRRRVGGSAGPIRAAARLVAELDALASLAEVAATGGYCRPELVEGRQLQIEAGRHPVVEQLLVEESFTANDLRLGEGIDASPDLLVLTGPNASGKSCYLRQNGLLQLMAQIGSWIP